MSDEQSPPAPDINTETLSDLKPCPHCGKSNKLVVRPYRADDDGGEPFDFGFNVICNATGFDQNPNRGCGAGGAWGETEADAIAAWNRRSTPIPEARKDVIEEALDIDPLGIGAKVRAPGRRDRGTVAEINGDRAFVDYPAGGGAWVTRAELLPWNNWRDALGRAVRIAWVKWAQTQPTPKASWLVPYDELSEPDKEADRQIGEAITRFASQPIAAIRSLSSAPASPAAPTTETPLQYDELVACLRECKKQLDVIIEDGLPVDWQQWRDDLDELLAHVAAPSPASQPKVEVSDEMVERFRNAVLACGHTIVADEITLFRSRSKDGNALHQLSERIRAALTVELSRLSSANEELAGALAKIEKWFGEFPETGRFWDEPKNTDPMSYGAAFGSNGERDYMRSIARAALKGGAP